MTVNLRALRIFVPMIAAVSCAFAVPAAASHAWMTYHWARTTDAFSLQVVNNLDKTKNRGWSTLLTASTVNADRLSAGPIYQWSHPTDSRVPDTGATPRGTSLFVTLNAASAAPSTTGATSTSGNNQWCNSQAGKVVACNLEAPGAGWLGIAEVALVNDHITWGTATMNDTYFFTNRLYAKYYGNKSQRLHVLCQEIAHTFGLGHQSTSGQSLDTCMDYYRNTSDSDKISTWPNTHDFGMLEQIYSGHVDSSTTIASALAAGAAVPSQVLNPKGWGNLVAQSRSGRHSVYERHYPNGVKVVTDVLWERQFAEKCPTCDHRNQR